MTELDWRSRTALRAHLADLGADIEFWEGAYPPEPPTGERLAEAEAIWDATDAKWPRLRAVSEKFGTPWASELLISVGDAAGISKASGFYRLALESSPRPNVDAEIGCLLMRRSGLKEMPFSERELEEMEPEIYDALFDVLEPPLGSPRTELISLALQAYGRAYGYYDFWWGCEDWLRDFDYWQHLLVLDGLLTGFVGMQNARGVELCCDVYDLWVNGMGERFTLFGSDVRKFERRFGEMAGAVKRGDMRRWKTRPQVRTDLASALGPTFPQLDRRAHNHLVSAEIDLFYRKEEGDDCSGSVNDYGKAVEAALQESFGRYAESDAGDPFREALRESVSGAMKRPTKTFTRVSLTTWDKALTNLSGEAIRRASFLDWARRSVPEVNQRWVDALVQGVNELSPLHDKARHSRDSWKVSREEAERARELCIGQEGVLHKLARLHPRRRGE